MHKLIPIGLLAITAAACTKAPNGLTPSDTWYIKGPTVTLNGKKFTPPQGLESAYFEGLCFSGRDNGMIEVSRPDANKICTQG